jgi:hypothetical protein
MSLSIVVELAEYMPIPLGFDLAVLDLLARTVEAYVLHDHVLCLTNIHNPLDYLKVDTDDIISTAMLARTITNSAQCSDQC